MPRYPIELDLSGRSVLVVGLGAVGRSRVAGLIECGARILAIDPGPFDSPPSIERVAESYRAEHLVGMELAFACATSEVNRLVVQDARAAGVWVYSASEAGSGDFSIPAIWRDGPVQLSVSTSGASPALSRTLRDRAAEAIGPGAATLATVLLRLRREIMEAVADPEARRRIYSAWGDPRWLELAENEGPETAIDALREMARKGAQPPL